MIKWPDSEGPCSRFSFTNADQTFFFFVCDGVQTAPEKTGTFPSTGVWHIDNNNINKTFDDESNKEIKIEIIKSNQIALTKFN